MPLRSAEEAKEKSERGQSFIQIFTDTRDEADKRPEETLYKINSLINWLIGRSIVCWMTALHSSLQT